MNQMNEIDYIKIMFIYVIEGYENRIIYSAVKELRRDPELNLLYIFLRTQESHDRVLLLRNLLASRLV